MVPTWHARPTGGGRSRRATELFQEPASGRLSAYWTADKAVWFSRSDDGGALWSRGISLAGLPTDHAAIEAEVAPDGRGAVVAGDGGSNGPITVA